MPRKPRNMPTVVPEPDAPTIRLSEHKQLIDAKEKKIIDLTDRVHILENENSNLHSKINQLLIEQQSRGDVEKVVEGCLYPGTALDKPLEKPKPEVPEGVKELPPPPADQVDDKPKLVKCRALREFSYTDWRGIPHTVRKGDVFEYEESVFKMAPKANMEKVIE